MSQQDKGVAEASKVLVARPLGASTRDRGPEPKQRAAVAAVAGSEERVRPAGPIVSPTPPRGRRGRRRWLRRAVLALAVLLLFGGGAILLLDPGGAGPQAGAKDRLLAAVGWLEDEAAGAVGSRAPVVVFDAVLPGSTDDRRIEIDQKLAIAIPGGLLRQPRRLKVTRRTERIEVGDQRILSRAVYDLALDEPAPFTQPITLELAFDKEESRGIEYLGAVALLDESVGRWILVPSDLDLEEGVARVRTRSLSSWTYLTIHRLTYSRTEIATARPSFVVEGWDPATERWVRDPRSRPSPPRVFNVAYRKADTASVGGRSVPIAELATKLAEALDEAVWGYHSRGYLVPFPGQGRALIALMEPGLSSGAGQYGHYTNFVYFPTSFSSEAEIRTTAAHEVFHAVQRAELQAAHGIAKGFLAMIRDVWMMEATAEYAAHRLAFDPPPALGSFYKVDVGMPMDDVNGFSEYADAHLFPYLMDEARLCPPGLMGTGVARERACFRAMWSAVTASRSRARTGLDDFIEGRAGTGRGLRYQYFNFLHWVLASEDAPEGLLAGQSLERPTGRGWTGGQTAWEHADGAATFTLRMRPPKDDGMRALTVPSPDAREKHLLRLEVLDEIAPGALVVVFKVAVDEAVQIRRAPGQPVPAAVLVAGRKRDEVLDLEPGQGLLVTLTSPARDVTTRVRLTALSGELPLEMVDLRARRGMTPVPHPLLGHDLVPGVSLGSPYVVRAVPGPLAPEVERVEVHWSMPPHFRPAAGSHTGPFRIDLRVGAAPGSQQVEVTGTFHLVGLNRVEATLLDATDRTRRVELQRGVLHFHTAAIQSVEVAQARRAGESGTPVIVTAHEPAGGRYRFRWHFGDGKVEETAAPSVRHVYDRPGSYELHLELLLPERLSEGLRVLARSPPFRAQIAAPAAPPQPVPGKGLVESCLRGCPAGVSGARCRAECEGVSPATSARQGEQCFRLEDCLLQCDSSFGTTGRQWVSCTSRCNTLERHGPPEARCR